MFGGFFVVAAVFNLASFRAGLKSKPNSPGSVLGPPVSIESMAVMDTMHGKLRFGWLDITNRSLLDAVVYLETVSPEGADISRRRAILVRAAEHGTLGSITSDAYAVFVAQGRQWLGTQRRFAAHYFMLSDRLNFTEEPTEAGVRLRQFSITLQPVGFGNARTEIINPVNFASRHIPRFEVPRDVRPVDQ